MKKLSRCCFTVVDLRMHIAISGIEADLMIIGVVGCIESEDWLQLPSEEILSTILFIIVNLSLSLSRSLSLFYSIEIFSLLRILLLFLTLFATILSHPLSFLRNIF